MNKGGLSLAKKEKTKVKGKGFKYYMKRDWQLYVLLALPLLFAIVFKFLPMFGLSVAFLNYDVVGGFEKAKFIGFDAFREIFGMKDFYVALRNTILLNGLDLIIGFPAPIILAIMLNEIRNKYFKRVTQTVLYLPHFLSWVIIAGIFYQLLSPTTGYINILISRMGGQSIPFLTEKWHWLISYCLIGVWQSMGWGTIIYLAAITGVNADLYEAAKVDGAGRWKAPLYTLHNRCNANYEPRQNSGYLLRASLHLGQPARKRFFGRYIDLCIPRRSAVPPL